MDVDLETLRLSVYRSLAATGRAPTVAELASEQSATPSVVDEALRRLADQRHVVLDEKGRIVMAHPFATIPLGFSVMGRDTLWWGGCAWDSFAMPHLLVDEPELLVATRCPACTAPHALVVGRERPPAGDQVAHFLVPVAQMWDDVVRTCSNQRLFCGPACVDRWLAECGQQRGDILDLATLWRLASHWYDGRLERGYRRRDPQEAADYFRWVGLRGAFWGLD